MKVRAISEKYGLQHWIDNKIQENIRGDCIGTEEEVEILSRIIDDERISRTDVPKILGKSYRQCFENDDFDKIKKLKHVGIYSKISTILHKNKIDGNKRKKIQQGE